ncbi:sugar ABC transporter substrate-binding protein [Sorangium cellulosum]|uniref:Sugar ABC transporter substrate-binding protein n=1 Tax=Sorangium cellulosum TaxID=56 RepID=A0A2L0ES60_SORCE|nr:polysaccharide biosynthesis/export family protein [Sorangium cellulosum]AUX42147.1 sugar ABC transporter substrate-binding protein [Sorangium cellulosum]
MRPRCAWIALLCSTLGSLAAPSGCGGRALRVDFEAERSATSAYVVGPGDVLEVRAWKNEALSRRVTVRPDGFITVPLVGDVMAAGRTGMTIAEEIESQAARYYNERPLVSVEVAELHSYRIYVMGEVSRPGEFTPRAQITVLQALALAGGFTRFADPDEVVIVRRDVRGERMIPFAFDEVVGKGDLRGDLPLQTNDTVVVP